MVSTVCLEASVLHMQRRDEDTRFWPVREVIVCVQVPNTIDDQGRAVRVTLSCGHTSILTGEHVGVQELPCRICGLKLPVRKKRTRF